MEFVPIAGKCRFENLGMIVNAAGGGRQRTVIREMSALQQEPGRPLGRVNRGT